MGTSIRARRVAVAVATAAVVLAVAVPVATAAAPQRAVHIVSHMDFHEGEFNTGTFVASGPAVTAGLICPSGTVQDTGLVFAGEQSGRGAQIPVWKELRCANGTGTLYVRIQVQLDFSDFSETFSWVAQGGTGPYAKVRGLGAGTTVPDPGDPVPGNTNTYDGSLRG